MSKQNLVKCLKLNCNKLVHVTVAADSINIE